MKTVTIGDTHGKAVAEVVLKIIDEHDKFIFIGDYVDSPVIDNQSMKKSLLEIIGLKKKHSDKIVLLWGNHDISYLLGNEYICSGYRPDMKDEFHEVFQSNVELFQLAFQAGNYLWTHAGISSWWHDARFMPFAEKQNADFSIPELLNIAFDKRYKPIFEVGYTRGGRSVTGGPLWCDIDELEEKPWSGLNQIVGHNKVDNFQRITSGDHEIVFVDVLHKSAVVDESCFFYKEV